MSIESDFELNFANKLETNNADNEIDNNVIENQAKNEEGSENESYEHKTNVNDATKSRNEVEPNKSIVSLDDEIVNRSVQNEINDSIESISENKVKLPNYDEVEHPGIVSAYYDEMMQDKKYVKKNHKKQHLKEFFPVRYAVAHAIILILIAIVAVVMEVFIIINQMSSYKAGIGIWIGFYLLSMSLLILILTKTRNHILYAIIYGMHLFSILLSIGGLFLFPLLAIYTCDNQALCQVNSDPAFYQVLIISGFVIDLLSCLFLGIMHCAINQSDSIFNKSLIENFYKKSFLTLSTRFDTSKFSQRSKNSVKAN